MSGCIRARVAVLHLSFAASSRRVHRSRRAVTFSLPACALCSVFDVSNRHRLGYSEVQLVQTMLDGLEKLIQLEQKLERGETVTL